MYITELSVGDKILISLSRHAPAYPTRTSPTSIVYKTNSRYKRHDITFTKGIGVVLNNANKILTIRFSDYYNPATSGIAAIDYNAVASIYLYEGETNAATVAEGLNDPTTAPAMEIYRNKVDIRWKG